MTTPAETSPLRGALIGVGRVARHGHLPGWRAFGDVALAAAADARPEGRDEFLAAYPSARWYDSAEELLAREELDFADVCTPPAEHARLAEAALGRGLHVLCEKPLALTSGEIAPLAAAARAADRALVTVHNWKHAPALAKVTELVVSGAVGAIRRIGWETRRREPAATQGAGNWRTDPSLAGGGILVDHGWHALYVLKQWLRGRPRTVSARLEKRRDAAFPVEDTASVALEWNGASAEIFLTWADSERRNRVAIEGDRGTLTLDNGRLTLDAAGGAPRVFELPSLAEGSHHPDWFCGVAREFEGEVRDPARRGANLEEASFCAETLARAYASSRAGGAPLPVPGQ